MISNTRRSLFLIIFLILIGLSTTRVVYSLDSETNKDHNYEEILSLDVNNTNSKIDYSLRDNGKIILKKAGVEAFTVDNEERIYLSNFATGKIIVYYKNEYEQEINITNFYQPRDIEVNNDLLYIFDDSGKITEIFLYDNSKLNEFNIPTIIKTVLQEKNEYNKAMPIRLINDYQRKQTSVLYDNNFLYLFRSGEKNKIPMDNYKLDLKGQVYKRLIGIDEKGYVYILGTEVREKNDKIEIKELIYKFSNTGKLLDIADTVDEKNYIVPFKYLALNSSGDVFQLLVKKNKLKVFKLKFKAKSGFKSLAKDNKTQEQTSIELTSFVEDKSLSFRKTLYNKATELINLKWTYNPKFNSNKLNDVVTPIYLKKIEKKQAMVGVPYCWGGYDSLKTKSKNQKWENFVDAVNKGAIVGNVGITLNYVPQTAGLDCSGFMSVVLDLIPESLPGNFFIVVNWLRELVIIN